MKKIAIAALTVGTLLSYTPFSPLAHAAPSGKLCTLTPGGVMEGGPLVLTTPTDTGNMTCAVRSGANSTYASPVHDSVTGPTTTGVVAVTGMVSLPGDRPLYVCTSVVDGATTYNRDYMTNTWVVAPAGTCLRLPWEPFGRLCGFASTTDQTGEPDVQTGVMDGGPLVVTDEYHTDPPEASMTCTLQVGANSTHAGTDAPGVGTPATGPTTPGVVFVPETQVQYEAAVVENVYLCTQVNFEGGSTLYWDSSEDPLVEGSWSTSTAASCSLATSASTPGDDEFPFDVLNPLLDEVLLLLCNTADGLPPAVHDVLHELLDCEPHV